MKVFLALPAYNEEPSLLHLLQAFEREMVAAGYRGHVVLVDDGSRDHTAEIARTWRSSDIPVDLVQHSVNCGLGTTLRDALHRAAELADPGDVIVTMDADNTHPPFLIPTMIRRLRHEGYDLVIASRYRSGARVIGLSLVRHLMSYGARLLFQIVLPIRGVRDYTCGFRAYRASIIQRAFADRGDDLIRERSFACMAEILLNLRKMQVLMCEVPLVLRYDQKAGSSKMNVGRTIARTLRLMFCMRVGLSADVQPLPNRVRSADKWPGRSTLAG